MRERVAATVPAERRLAALDAVDALLGLALTLDGARYATPYNFVRALKRRAAKVATPAHADAVQLLTVHGAKGLEAKVVFVMDADPEPQAAETATLLIDWPVEAEAPRCCAFVYAESDCPAALAPLLERERQARAREELNGLYVAMTRARQRLVFSATPPRSSRGPASWWARIAPLALPFAMPPAAPLEPGPAGAGPAAAPVVAMPREIVLKAIAPLAPLAAPRVAADRAPPRTEATRLGEAVHRVLEWATAPGTAHDAGAGAFADLSGLAQAAATEFGASPVATLAIARRIVESPACAPYFGGAALRWAGNEVPVSEAGEVLRIDRLVHLADPADPAGPVWWVLDYKLQQAPEQLVGFREQLLRYRAAVQRAQPGARVRCAFITGTGAVVEVG